MRGNVNTRAHWPDLMSAFAKIVVILYLTDHNYRIGSRFGGLPGCVDNSPSGGGLWGVTWGVSSSHAAAVALTIRRAIVNSRFLPLLRISLILQRLSQKQTSPSRVFLSNTSTEVHWCEKRQRKRRLILRIHPNWRPKRGTISLLHRVHYSRRYQTFTSDRLRPQWYCAFERRRDPMFLLAILHSILYVQDLGLIWQESG